MYTTYESSFTSTSIPASYLSYVRIPHVLQKEQPTTSTAPRHPLSRICPIACLRCVSSPVSLFSPLSSASLSQVLLPTEMQLKPQCHHPTTQSKTSQTTTPPPPMSRRSPSSAAESQAHHQPITCINCNPSVSRSSTLPRCREWCNRFL